MIMQTQKYEKLKKKLQKKKNASPHLPLSFNEIFLVFDLFF